MDKRRVSRERRVMKKRGNSTGEKSWQTSSFDEGSRNSFSSRHNDRGLGGQGGGGTSKNKIAGGEGGLGPPL